MPGGRPEIPIDLKAVERLASRGLNEAQISNALGVDNETLRRRKKKYKEFRDILRRGKARGVAAVANHLFNQSENGNTSAAIFYLKNRAGWTDKADVSIGGNGTPVENKILVEFVGADED